MSTVRQVIVKALASGLGVDLERVAGQPVVTGGVAGSQGVGGLQVDDDALAGNPVPVAGLYLNPPTQLTGTGRVGIFLSNFWRQMCVGGYTLEGDTADTLPPVKLGAVVDEILSSPLSDGQIAQLVTDLDRQLRVRNPAYDPTSVSDRVSPTYTVGHLYDYEQEFVDTTNLPIATYYYPSAVGLYTEHFNLNGIHIRLSTQIRLTVEATNDDAAAPDWENITPSVVFVSSSLGMVVSGLPFFTNANGHLYLPDALFAKYRLVLVVLNATNTAQMHHARRSM